MLLRLVSFFVVVASASACATVWPNGTDTAFHWFPCGGAIQFSKATPQTKDGKFSYPVHLSAPLIVMTEANNPTTVYSSPTLKQTINIWQWAQYGSCTWSAVPTFGLLKDLDACTNGVNCPINLGEQAIPFELDFSEYGAIINLLKDDAPYQMQYVLNNGKIGAAACITFQARTYLK